MLGRPGSGGKGLGKKEEEEEEARKKRWVLVFGKGGG
jgi:hypothetical protein